VSGEATNPFVSVRVRQPVVKFPLDPEGPSRQERTTGQDHSPNAGLAVDDAAAALDVDDAAAGSAASEIL
jgi:hypothetical protein